MRILVIDAIKTSVDFIMRAEAQGHEVRLWMPKTGDHVSPKIGEGLVAKVDNWQSSMRWADLIVLTDNARFLHLLENYRKQGYPIWGPHRDSKEWELDRMRGQRLMEAHGIPTIPSIEFTDYDKAIAFVLANKDKRFVSKPMGDVAKALSYVSKTWEDLVFMLEFWKRTQKMKAAFILQEFLPGIEMAVGGWVGRNGFLGTVLENFEFKKLMPGDSGVNTGEMGTVMKHVPKEKSLLFRQMLQPIEAELIRTGYTGYIDMAAIIPESGDPGPLEFTSRPGWPTEQIVQILRPDIANWMKDALEGRDSYQPFMDIAVGMQMGLPDYPYCTTPIEEVSGFPIFGITEKNRYFIHPGDVRLGKVRGKPMLVSEGHYAVVVSGQGKTVKSARTHAYSNLKELNIPNSPLHRDDIGERLEAQLPKLQKRGYATEWKWA